MASTVPQEPGTDMSEADTPRLFVGVDVGATKIMAAVAGQAGDVRARARRATPRTDDPQEAVASICAAIDGAVQKAGIAPEDISAIGLAVAAVVDPEDGKVVATPNMSLAGLDIVTPLEERYGAPVALGNDVNLGTLGEKWLGAGRHLDSVVGVFVGTGIGGGVVIEG